MAIARHHQHNSIAPCVLDYQSVCEWGVERSRDKGWIVLKSWG